MACSKEILDDSVQLAEKGYDEEDLTTCSICLSMIDEPKALPCLHTFCLKCLSEWAKSTKTVTCPICRKDWTLPAGGVAGLESNFLVNKLKDRKTVRNKLASKGCIIPCTSCDGSNQPAVARCVECDDFLCENCLKPHKTMRKLKGHHTFTLDELHAGKADPVEKTEYCSKHQGQVLWIYCETCGMLICRDCTVFDHCKPEHKFVDIQTAAKDQRAKIEELAEECKNFAIHVDEAIQNDTETASKLDASVTTAMEGLSEAYEETKSSLLKQLETNYNVLASEIKNEGTRGRKGIDTHTEELNVLKSRVRTALKTASELAQSGSDSDVAQMYASLTSSLKELRDIQKPPVQKKRVEAVTFKASSVRKTLDPIGSVSSNVTETKRVKRSDWKNKNYVSFFNSPISDICLIKGSADEKIVVHEFTAGYKYANFGNCNIAKVATYGPSPFGVVSNENGEIFMTSHDSMVYKFASDATYISSFIIYQASSSISTLGLTITRDRLPRLVVGEWYSKNVSIHSQDGVLISKFSVSVHPWYISANSKDHLAVSCNSPSMYCHACTSVVDVVDINASGKLLFRLKTPTGVQSWGPKGVCWSQDDLLFVANSTGEKGVHQFSSSGEYLGCIIEGLSDPTCLTISENDELVVADGKKIKIYH